MIKYAISKNIKNDYMKTFIKTILFLILGPALLVGCNDLLDVDSDRTVTPDEYSLDATNDTLYSMFAVFSQLEKLADNYVLLGELRGDLMDLGENASAELKEINNFDISSDNSYTQIKDYYAVINNCNYIIQKIDTSVVGNGEKVMLKEYAACKAIRAWTYMQIALNYGSAIYYEQPILTVEEADSIQNLSASSIDELIPKLVADLQPYKDIAEPSLGSLYGYDTQYSYFPIRFLLGDLYLWAGDYANAAQQYYDLINKESYLIRSGYYISSWEVLNNAFSGTLIYTNNGFPGIFEPMSYEQITDIAATNQYGQVFQLDSLTSNKTLIPSDVALNNWDSQMYYYSDNLYKNGDLRKLGSVLPSTENSYTYVSLFDTTTTSSYDYYITKYLLLNPSSSTYKVEKMVIAYRIGLLYLRYAEALNRMGKPNTALAIIKNGLNAETLNNSSIIPHKELTMNVSGTDTTYSIPSYMNFTSSTFDDNIGIRMRGLGNVDDDNTYYIIPELDSQEDSILYVEDKIQEELALETAFEGNRFQDLMRFAIRRNDNSYLADKVAAKYSSNQESIRTKLMTRSNWYLPTK